MPQIRQLMEHLEDGSRGKWKLENFAEGQLHLLHDATLAPPTIDDLVWDGESERIEIERPPFDGPELPLNEIFTPLHTRQGCYNHRGRLADVFIICIGRSTATSTEEDLPAVG